MQEAGVPGLVAGEIAVRVPLSGDPQKIRAQPSGKGIRIRLPPKARAKRTALLQQFPSRISQVPELLVIQADPHLEIGIVQAVEGPEACPLLIRDGQIAVWTRSASNNAHSSPEIPLSNRSPSCGSIARLRLSRQTGSERIRRNCRRILRAGAPVLDFTRFTQRSEQPCFRKHLRSGNAEKYGKNVCERPALLLAPYPRDPLGFLNRDPSQPGDAVDDDDAQQVVEKMRNCDLMRGRMSGPGNRGRGNVIDLATGARRQLTTSLAIDTAPSFSPDGRNIVFESDRGGRKQLYVVPATGGRPARISRAQGQYGTPVWSPRGDQIAFTKIDRNRFHIGVMRTDGTREKLLTESFLDEGPTWSPNGRVLMFFRESRGRDGAPSLFSVDLTGRNLRGVDIPGFGSDPAWSRLRTP